MSKETKQPTRPTLSQGDEEFLIMCASRYCIGRSTYAPHMFLNLVCDRFDHLSIGCLSSILRDIESALPDGLGSQQEESIWLDMKAKIERRLGK